MIDRDILIWQKLWLEMNWQVRLQLFLSGALWLCQVRLSAVRVMAHPKTQPTVRPTREAHEGLRSPVTEGESKLAHRDAANSSNGR